MKKHSTSSLYRALRQTAAAPPERPAEEFWSEFRARATMTVQQAPGSVSAIAPVFGIWRSAGAVAAALVLALALTATFLAPGTHGSKRLSRIDEVDIFLEYDSVMIMEDQENGGTVLWLADAGSLTKN